MNTLVTANPFRVTDNINIARYRPVNQLIGKMLEQISGLGSLGKIYESDVKLSELTNADEFIEHALKLLEIEYSLEHGQNYSIPESGGLVVVANHPFGGIDGLILANLLRQKRNDVKIIANGFLKKIPALADLFFDVDPINPEKAVSRNATSLKHAIKWVQNGGCLIVFPAGEVSHLNLREHRITDPEWNISIARIIKIARADVLPICFEGSNSLNFHLMGLLHPRLRTLLLPREMLKKTHSKIRLHIGKPINYSRIRKVEDKKLICLLRLSTYALQNINTSSANRKNNSWQHTINIAEPIPSVLLKSELDYLPENQLLHQTDNVSVIYASSAQIPWLLKEIGRLRELSFREVGEGTGQDIDLDKYDQYYTHLFLWDRKQHRIMGAYRLGLTDQILNLHGLKGLYSYSLFKYTVKELRELGPAIELGRSFICSDYQRSPAALSLLWKGIGLFVANHHYYTTLFGPVSISNDYQETSRKFIVDCLRTSCLMRELGQHIKPRKPFKTSNSTNWKRRELKTLEDIDLVSEVVSQIEQGQRGIPILIKQYLKLGGRFLEFNIDENFNDAIDGLIFVDLRETNRQLLDYFMGKENSRHYLMHVSQNFRKAS